MLTHGHADGQTILKLKLPLRSAKNTLAVNRPLISIPMLRFTSIEITQEVSALSMSKINRLGDHLLKKVKKKFLAIW